MSLGTRDPKEALQLGKALEYYIAEITRRYGSTIMNDQEAKQLVSDYLKSKLEEQKKRIDTKPYYTDTLKSWSDAMNTIEADPAPYTEKFISKMGLDVSTDSDDFQMLARYIRHNIPEYFNALKDYNSQAFRINMKADKAQEVKAIYKLDDVVVKFHEASKKERDWGGDRKREMHRFLNTLKEILGDYFNTMDMDKRQADSVLEVIYNLPANRNKNPLTRDLGIKEAINIAGINKISSRTIEKYLIAYNMFFEWCENRGYSESNPFKNLQGNIARNKKDTQKRYAFSDDEIQSILTELNKYPDGNSIAKKEYEYWGSLIGLYTGARLNEIAQLELDDIKQIDGMWYFDINDSGDKQLKTEASQRKIPVHDKLIELKLLEYVDNIKKQGKTRLLYQLSYTANKGYGKNLGRFFNARLLPRLGIKDKNISFHCLRHTVNTKLLQADVELSKIQYIIGHTPTIGMTKEYANEGFKLKQLHEALHKLPY